MKADVWRADPELARKLALYARAGRNRVGGWFLRSDAEIFSAVLFDQTERQVDGAALEIGVHHGRSFVPLTLCSSPAEPAIAIDIFDRQELNTVDPSGRGDYAVFRRNIERHGSWSRARLIASSSLELTPADLGSRLRFASVDGAHWHNAVVSDLRLVEAAAAEDCVIALDDMFNPTFPEVMSGFFDWVGPTPAFHAARSVGGQGLLLQAGAQGAISASLTGEPPSSFNHVKTIDFLGSPVLVLAGFGGRLRPTLARVVYTASPRLHGVLKQLVNGRRPTGSPSPTPLSAEAPA